MPMSKPRRQHEVSGVILARLHAALQATSDTWQRCRAPRAAHRPRQTASGWPVWLLSGGSLAPSRRGGWKPGNMFGQGGWRRKKTQNPRPCQIMVKNRGGADKSGSASNLSVPCGMCCGQSIGGAKMPSPAARNAQFTVSIIVHRPRSSQMLSIRFSC